MAAALGHCPTRLRTHPLFSGARATAGRHCQPLCCQGRVSSRGKSTDLGVLLVALSRCLYSTRLTHVLWTEVSRGLLPCPQRCFIPPKRLPQAIVTGPKSAGLPDSLLRDLLCSSSSTWHLFTSPKGLAYSPAETRPLFLWFHVLCDAGARRGGLAPHDSAVTLHIPTDAPRPRSPLLGSVQAMFERVKSDRHA